MALRRLTSAAAPQQHFNFYFHCLLSKHNEAKTTKYIYTIYTCSFRMSSMIIMRGNICFQSISIWDLDAEKLKGVRMAAPRALAKLYISSQSAKSNSAGCDWLFPYLHHSSPSSGVISVSLWTTTLVTDMSGCCSLASLMA